MRGDTPQHAGEGAAQGACDIQHPVEDSTSQGDAYKANSPEERADTVQEGPDTRHHHQAARQEATDWLTQ